MGVVIGETTVIRDHCHIFQGVTLGGTSTLRDKRHPTLENHVVVGAGAKIIGAVTIGEGSRIGAGAVVVSSVPPHATVVGVPGHVVAYTSVENETVERLPDPEWDRIDALERRLDRLEGRLRAHGVEAGMGDDDVESRGNGRGLRPRHRGSAIDPPDTPPATERSADLEQTDGS
jgi:serine O-acetyltransferase